MISPVIRYLNLSMRKRIKMNNRCHPPATRWALAVLALPMILVHSATAAGEAFRLGNESVEPGSRARVTLEVPALDLVHVIDHRLSLG